MIYIWILASNWASFYKFSRQKTRHESALFCCILLLHFYILSVSALVDCSGLACFALQAAAFSTYDTMRLLSLFCDVCQQEELDLVRDAHKRQECFTLSRYDPKPGNAIMLTWIFGLGLRPPAGNGQVVSLLPSTTTIAHLQSDPRQRSTFTPAGKNKAYLLYFPNQSKEPGNNAD